MELNHLEKTAKKVQNVPCADLLSYFVLEKVLSMLRDKGIVLPFLWNLPDSKDASFLMTIDEDWAPPIVLKDALRLFRSKRVPVTLFITKPLDEHEDLQQDDLIDFSIHPYHKEDDRYMHAKGACLSKIFALNGLVMLTSTIVLSSEPIEYAF